MIYSIRIPNSYVIICTALKLSIMLLFFFIANSTSNSILNCQSCYCSGIVCFLLSTLLQFNVQRSKIMKNAYEFHPLLNPCQFFPVGLVVTCLSIVTLFFIVMFWLHPAGFHQAMVKIYWAVLHSTPLKERFYTLHVVMQTEYWTYHP